MHNILFIAERGLTFLCSDEKFNSKHNRKFMGMVELISEFDQTLKQLT